MKKIKILLIIVISFFISVTNCFAQEIDVNKICSITGKYNYSDVSISDTKIYLYRIADISNIAKYTYVSDFSSFTKLTSTVPVVLGIFVPLNVMLPSLLTTAV